ncbi:hypothetical protein Tco_1252316, partial [Tanacetum coccineum]
NGNSSNNDLNLNSFNDPPNDFTHPPQPQYETYLCELCGNDSHFGYDCPPRFSLVYEQECEDMIDELKSKFNGMSIEINKKKELQCLEQVANLSTSQRFKSFCYDDDDDYDYEERSIPLRDIISKLPPSIVITSILPTLEPEDSLIMGNEELSTILKKESDEFIKSSVEDLVPILNESDDTSETDSDLPSCDNLSPINVSEEKSVTFSNPLFNSNDDFTSSDDESLSDEDVPEDNFKI